ncbi:uncharacterized protein LOC120330298 isoform X1 [Styela clava]
MSDKRSRDYDYTSSSDILNRKPSRSFSMKSQKPPDVKLRSVLSKAISHFDRTTDDNARAKYIKEIHEVVEAAWQLPVIGRDLAYEIGDTLRREKIVSFLVNSLQLEAATPTLQRECARLLSQILTTDNRHYISKNALEILTKYTKQKEDIDIIRINVSILESLFKDSEATCTRLIDMGALDTVVHACRHDDLWTARHCAAALANAAIYGGSINHRKMVVKGAPDWLFPLAFRTDDFCRYYSCLAVTVLAANPLVEKAVLKSGTLELVEPFVQSHDPYEFAQSNPSHAQGRSASFLQRMIPLLISGRPEAQALASFYFAMEASIKAKQQKTQIPETAFLIFSEIAAIIPLKRVIATSRSSIARILAGRCLKIIGEDVPRKLSPQIHLWDMEDVQSWLTVAGFRAFHASFRASTVDGEMLLLLTERELKEDLSMANNVHRKRFIRDLNRLRAGADYRSVDTTGICEWLRQIEPKFAQYTYRFLQAGVDRSFLPIMTDAHLRDDCGIDNGVHRTRILASIQNFDNNTVVDEMGQAISTDHDVFISYRRNNGSHLASLLKVHLQVRGYRVFLDVDSLQEGDFADRTLKSVKSVTAGFILILTAGALDKCAIDHEGTDWLHKEIVTAIGNRRNIVPVTTETFQWPLPEDLPQDIAPICFYNGVKWIHEYQDACVAKIDRFLKGQDPPSSKLSRIASVQSGRSGLGMSQKRRSAHPNNTVRPSGSSDNLMDQDRIPRPRQRASPPGQASSLLGATAPTTRSNVTTGAQSENARSMDQGDGASAPFEQGSKQMHANKYPSPNKVKSPVKKSSDGNIKKLASPSGVSSSSTSTASSKNISAGSKGIKKDIVRLDDVMSGDRDRSRESDSESEYSSTTGSEEWELENEPRSGADGKSKPDTHPKPVKSPPANARTVVAQVEKSPNGNIGKMEKIGAKKLQGMQEKKSPTKQTSPENKPKPSSKYKAPPPPPPTYDSVTAATESSPVHDPPPPIETPEPRPRPTITPRPKSAEPPNKDAPLTARSEPGKTVLPKSSVPNGIDGKASLKSATSVPNVAEKNEPVLKTGVPKQPSAIPRDESPNMVQKPPRMVMSKETAHEPPANKAKSAVENNKKTSEIPFVEDRSDSEYSDDSNLDEIDNNSHSNERRTNADGIDGTSSRSLSRTSSSTPSDLSHSATEVIVPLKTSNSNNNNNNATQINGMKNTKPEPKPMSMKDRNTRQNAGSQTTNHSKSSNSTRSTPLSRSSHSVGSADTHSPPRSPTKTAPPGTGKPIARRDIAPPSVPYQPKRSASERLQVTRPPCPGYPMGHFHSMGPTPQHQHHHPPQNVAGYNMEQYKAAMAASIRAPYPGHQHYAHAPTHTHPKARPGPPAHGFDTAV